MFTCTFIITVWKEIVQKIELHKLTFKVIVFAIAFKWRKFEKTNCTFATALCLNS